jgi:hypothetical protein
MNTRVRLPTETIFKLKRMYERGEKYIVIQHELGVANSTIRKYRNVLGLTHRIPHAKHKTSAHTKRQITRRRKLSS